jgi:hypothetical protein
LEIYSSFVIFFIPICQQKWEIYFGVELPWEEIWGRHFKNLANRKSKQLQWKVIHRIIYTEERLQKMNKSPNGGCHFCKDPENSMHLFVNCKLGKQLDTKHICHFCIDIIYRFTFGKRKYE